jgi:2-methylisocitrate lyase-like PEP mutase family enzyme
VYPIGVADEPTIAAFVELGMPVNILLAPGGPPVERLAQLGVARVSLGHHLHAAAMDVLARRLAELSPRNR